MNFKNFLRKKLLNIYADAELIDIKISQIKHVGIGKNTVNKHTVPWGGQYIELEKKIDEEGYKPEEYGYPMITSNLYCIEGNHRIAILNDKLGEDKVVKVEKINKKFLYVFLLSVILVLLGHKE